MTGLEGQGERYRSQAAGLGRLGQRCLWAQWHVGDCEAARLQRRVREDVHQLAHGHLPLTNEIVLPQVVIVHPEGKLEGSIWICLEVFHHIGSSGSQVEKEYVGEVWIQRLQQVLRLSL